MIELEELLRDWWLVKIKRTSGSGDRKYIATGIRGDREETVWGADMATALIALAEKIKEQGK